MASLPSLTAGIVSVCSRGTCIEWSRNDTKIRVKHQEEFSNLNERKCWKGEEGIRDLFDQDPLSIAWIATPRLTSVGIHDAVLLVDFECDFGPLLNAV